MDLDRRGLKDPSDLDWYQFTVNERNESSEMVLFIVIEANTRLQNLLDLL